MAVNAENDTKVLKTGNNHVDGHFRIILSKCHKF